MINVADIFNIVKDLGIAGLALYFMYSLYNKTLDRLAILSVSLEKLAEKIDKLCDEGR